jgi:2-oxo-4-hydroxy-4-carboxy-5-ureidoimidazoline decarboxylase
VATAIDRFNSLPAGERDEMLSACLRVSRWVSELNAGLPFADVDALIAAADAAATPLSPDEVTEALAAHPRIGEHAGGEGREQRFSAAEQGANDDEPEIVTALAEGNRAYEERFGRVFLIRAAGRGRRDIVAELQRRLGNDDDSEAVEVSEQLRDIALLRLRETLTVI